MRWVILLLEWDKKSWRRRKTEMDRGKGSDSRWMRFCGVEDQLLTCASVAENDTACWKAAGGEILPAFTLLELIMITL